MEANRVIQQVQFLIYRNALVKRRSPREIVLMLYMPLNFVVILVILATAIPTTFFPAEPMSPPIEVPCPPELLLLPNPLFLGFIPGNSAAAANVMSAVINNATVRTFASAELLPFNTNTDAEAYFLNNPNGLHAVVEFQNVLADGSLASQIDLVLRFNGSVVPSSLTIESSQTDCRQNQSCTMESYLSSGFVDLQLALADALSQQLLGTSLNVQGSVALFPKESYVSQWTSFSTLIALYIVIAMAYILQVIMTNIVQEKEQKIKEGMSMMGLLEISYFLSWFLFYAMVIVVLSIVITFLCIFGHVFPKSNFFLIWVMLLFYGLSLVAFAFGLAPFFNNAKAAGAVGPLITIVLSVIYVPIAGVGLPTSSATQWACSLLSPVALALGLGEAVAHEDAGQGLNFSSFLSSTSTPGFSAGAALLMIFIDILFYSFLAWYFDSVVPSTYGTKRLPWFLFQHAFWCGGQQAIHHAVGQHDIAPLMDSIDVEPVPHEIASQIAIDVEGLSKIYPGSEEAKIALDHVSLQMYEGQIFGLLGHNGAGKTTLLSILSGLFSASSGSASIFGLDVATDMHTIRKTMGVCPQQNILFDQLTVREHLVVFAGIKCIPRNDIQDAVDQILHQVDLEDCALKRAESLSGGQKRKLSVGMALLGNPKVIVLDEPSAGMDPFSRRKLWDLLQSVKKGRVVLITSHFLDEIDILADRKAILSHGRVRCCGSSLFLKTRFGLGYHLTIESTDKCDAEKLGGIVSKHVSDATNGKAIGTQLTYRLPLASVKSFAGLFKELDSHQEELGIASYAINMTSLEEVFLRLQDEDHLVHADPAKGRVDNNSRLEPIDTVPQTAFVQFKALAHAKLLQSFRSPRNFAVVLVIPILFMLIGLIIFVATPSASTSPVLLPLNVSMYGDYAIPVLNATNASINAFLNDLPFPYTTTFDDNANDSFINVSFCSALQVNNYTAANMFLNETIFVNATAIHAGPSMWASTLSAMFANNNYTINMSSFPFPNTAIVFDGTSYSAILLIGISLSITPALFATDVVRDRQNKIKHQLAIMGLNPLVYWTATFVRDWAMLAVPAVFVVILIAAFNVPGLTGLALFPVFLTLLFFTPVVILVSYVISHLFSTAEFSMMVLPAISNILTVVGYVVVATIDQGTLRHTAMIIHYCLLAVDPFYGFSGSLHYIYMVYAVSLATHQEITMAMYFDPANNVIGTILMTIGHGVLALLALIAIEHYNSRRNTAVSQATMPVDEELQLQHHEEEDEAVRHERLKAAAGLVFDRENVVAVHDLRKVYPKPLTPEQEQQRKQHLLSCGMKGSRTRSYQTAVSKLSFGVRPNECFGLLGPNGAGKTTTLGMITADVQPSDGYTVVAQKDTRTHSREAFDKMGYCPQFDALFDDLTCKEHLVLYSIIKGVPSEMINGRVESFLNTLGLVEYTDKVVRQLSGGTKRKVSFCIAMIGSPAVAVLDEPSTGMDPASRRFMWDIIIESIQGRAAILTTHSMEEADALCGRIGIMVKGKLQCLGTAQQLKSKFGDGYTLEVKVPMASVDNFKQFMVQTFPAHSIMEEYSGRITFKLSQLQLSLGHVFSVLEEQKQALGVEEYSFSQTTLEQVFLAMAKRQDDIE